MRKITGLDERVVKLLDDTKDEELATFRKCFQMAAGQGQSRTADESRRAVRVLAKLKGTAENGRDIELSDEEFKTLVDRVSFNQPQFNTWVHGQLLEKLDTCDK